MVILPDLFSAGPAGPRSSRRPRFLIPSNRTYVQQMRVYEGNTGRSGLHHYMHGLRHAFTRDRYQELTAGHVRAGGLWPKS